MHNNMEEISVIKNNSNEWHWFKGGILVSILSSVSYVLFELENYRNYPYGITGGYGYIASKFKYITAGLSDNPVLKRYAEKPDSYIEFLILVGVVIGSFTAAKLSKTYSPEYIPAVWKKYHGPSIPKRFVTVFLGSTLLGFGAALSGGCTTGNILQGWSNLSPGSMLAGISFFVTGIITAKFLYNQKKSATISLESKKSEVEDVVN